MLGAFRSADARAAGQRARRHQRCLLPQIFRNERDEAIPGDGRDSSIRPLASLKLRWACGSRARLQPVSVLAPVQEKKEPSRLNGTLEVGHLSDPWDAVHLQPRGSLGGGGPAIKKALPTLRLRLAAPRGRIGLGAVLRQKTPRRPETCVRAPGREPTALHRPDAEGRLARRIVSMRWPAKGQDQRSMAIATPWPPPMHKVARPFLASRRFIS